MKCSVCDTLLTDVEATRRHKVTKEFIDMCSVCATVLPESAIETQDLLVHLERGTIDYIVNEDYDS